MNEFKPGSMGAAEEKAEKRFLIVATIVVLIIMSMLYLNLPPTFLNDWHKKAGAFFKYGSLLPFIASIYFMWVGRNISWSETGAKNYGLIAIGLVALGIAMGCGFNFDLK